MLPKLPSWSARGLAGLLISGVLGFSSYAAAGTVDDFENSWAGKALKHQSQLSNHAPLSTINMMGTHNSYNSEVYTTPLRYLDPQQKFSIGDQLRMGARFLELDAHWTAHTHGWAWEWGVDMLLCHSGIGAEMGDLDVGCSLTDRRLTDGLQEIKSWLDGNPNEVIILYIEDHTNGEHAILREQLNSKLGERIYKSGSCRAIPDELSRADVLEAGKQVVLWKDKGCANDTELAGMAFSGLGNVRRVYEDATNVAAISDFFTGGGGVERISAEDVGQAFLQGVNIVNLDDMTPKDGRLQAGVWSWDVNEPNNYQGNQDCAVSWANGRWDDARCSVSEFFACENAEGQWAVSQRDGEWFEGVAACEELGNGFAFSVPDSTLDNEALKQAKASIGVERVWLNYHDLDQEGVWEVVGRKTFSGLIFRELRDERSGRCLDISGNNSSNGTNVQLWDCNGTGAQKWALNALTGQMINANGRCLDIPGDDNGVGNGANVQIWSCQEQAVDQRWILDGGVLKNQKNPAIVLDAYGTDKGSNAGLWESHGGSNQQWVWGQ
ncbi:ricin-type beta-trefoil lectin domain protein [Parendozoicomonas haliclonae]|uniref:Extracellular exo-alpha-L-arabinofuranosidase n=1 Tax=Parendozoicomonas haliclonae TaxID=1960125 RepID=A0A1X7AKB8_9GAMM|nr:ricin-type beta-trefoil lectin domain protein [Parendozoicomonas haliclonae]SMA47217.1 Extracellular exo-alpha-L-arabinofuranosidase precursor [Parendozoicomonas haliclonae]